MGSQQVDPTTGIPIAPVTLTGSYQKKVTIANAVALTTTTAQFYNLITNGGLTEDLIRQFKYFKISIYSTLGVAVDVVAYDVSAAWGVNNATGVMAIYSVTNALAANNYLTLSPYAGGTGVGQAYVSVPALQGVRSNVIVRITPETAPLSGSLTIVVEMS